MDLFGGDYKGDLGSIYFTHSYIHNVYRLYLPTNAQQKGDDMLLFATFLCQHVDLIPLFQLGSMPVPGMCGLRRLVQSSSQEAPPLEVFLGNNKMLKTAGFEQDL